MPIISYSIVAALESGCFEEVMVSTDDMEIADIARSCGAVVPFMRSAETANDYATTADVLLEVLREYGRIGRDFTAACCVYPAAPLVTPERLREGMETLISDVSVESVVPVLTFGYPIQRALKIESGRVKMIAPEHINSRSQDLLLTYHDAGQWYWFRTAPFRSCGQLFGAACAPIILPETEAQDIDHEEDWRMAELKFKVLKEKSTMGRTHSDVRQ